MRPFASLPVAQVVALLVLVLAAVVASAGCECVFVLPDGGTRIESAAVTATPIFFLPKSMGCAPFAVMNSKMCRTSTKVCDFIAFPNIAIVIRRFLANLIWAQR